MPSLQLVADEGGEIADGLAFRDAAGGQDETEVLVEQGDEAHQGEGVPFREGVECFIALEGAGVLFEQLVEEAEEFRFGHDPFTVAQPAEASNLNS